MDSDFEKWWNETHHKYVLDYIDGINGDLVLYDTIKGTARLAWEAAEKKLLADLTPEPGLVG